MPVRRADRAARRPRHPRSGCSSASLSQEAGVFRRLADWGDYRLGDVYADENEPLPRPHRRRHRRRARQVDRSARCSTS